MNATMSLEKIKHYPVMLNQVLSIISPQRGGTFIDCTFGAGGYSEQILKFPRISMKLAWMAMETTVARQITLFSAREKDNDVRCDIEAGMAKLLAARVAWSNADSALQIHGGNGYALEYPISRVLCDSRILNIFEGAAEIQAQIVVKGLLGR